MLTIAGIIEGFYGRPWTWPERARLMRECHGWGMSHYVYAPKDDPKHRDRWRDPYDGDELDGFAGLAAEGTLAVGFGISPGLSIDYRSADDRAALLAKVDQVVGTGVRLVVLALDDIPFGGGPLGRDHAELAQRVRDHLADRADLVLVPTEYVGIAPTPYLDALAAGVPRGVPIAWTGAAVVNRAITADEARHRAAALGDRPPLVWDNFPVNDGIMTDRLHLGPLTGRDPELVAACGGYLANPMVQPVASLLPLASIAAWWRGHDPQAAWVAEADLRGWRTFAEACDGAVPTALVAAALPALDHGGDALEALGEWLRAAAACDAPGIDDAAAPWVEQVHLEARLALDALELVRRGRDREITSGVEHAFGVGFLWALARRAEKSVLGPRFGLQPVLGQRPDGTWSFDATSVIEDQSAVDALLRAAFTSFAAASTGPPGVRARGRP